ncbi:MAG TPA: hypothetical protein IAA44_07970 [Candidatus Blautia avistercoris]|nr:hypothetical protein [Candidatus Blautia avistercoris]
MIVAQLCYNHKSSNKILFMSGISIADNHACRTIVSHAFSSCHILYMSPEKAFTV